MPAQELSLGITLAVLGAGSPARCWNALLKSRRPAIRFSTRRWSSRARRSSPLLLPCSSACRRSPRGRFIAIVLGDSLRVLPHAGGGLSDRGDLSFAYPLMRGVAPLIVTVLGVLSSSREHAQARRRLSASRSFRRASSVIAFVRERPPSARRRGRGRSPTPSIIARHAGRSARGARASGNAAGYVCVADLPRRPAVSRLWIAWRRGPGAARYRGLAAGGAVCAGGAWQPRGVWHRAVGDDARTGRRQSAALREVSVLVRRVDRRARG